MAGAAVGAASAAGGFAGLPVADHAAHNEAEQRRDREDQHEIDKICREQREHGITSFPEMAAVPDGPTPPKRKKKGITLR